MKSSSLRVLLVLTLGLGLSGCNSLSAPGWLWPFGADEPDAATAQPAPVPAAVRAPIAPSPAPNVPPIAEGSGDDAILGFHDRAEAFYNRLAQRRFNTLATYNDPTLRSYFETQEGYSDYYARLAQELTDAKFEKNRPLMAELQEFTLEGPDRARVRFRLVGRSSRPFRFWSTSIEGEDVWQRAGGRWWVVPAKL